MPRTYRLPSFNITANVWHGALPHDITTWNGLVPSATPSIVTPAQLYYPRNPAGRQLHAVDEALSLRTVLKTGWQMLRVPKGTGVFAPGIVLPTAGWEMLDVVEVPAGSGRLYVVTMVDDAHAGFANEYRVALLSQIGNAGSGGAMTAGSAVTASTSPPPALSSLTAGSAVTATTASSGGSPTPGTDCLSAFGATIPFSYSGSIAAFAAHQWFKFSLGAGNYHARLSVTGTYNISATVQKGTCASLSGLGGMNNLGQCQAFTLGSGLNTVYIEVQGPPSGTTTYTLEVDTGGC